MLKEISYEKNISKNKKFLLCLKLRKKGGKGGN